MRAQASSQEPETGLENVRFLELLLGYEKVRARTLRICAPLEAEDTQVQSMPDVSPAKWHLAHTTWFFENFLLKPTTPAFEPFHPSYGFLFNSYYKSQGKHWDRPRRGLLSRPTLKEVLSYRDWTDTGIFRLLSAEPSGQGSLSWREIRERAVLGLNHEEQHQELLYTDILHVLGSNPLKPVYGDGGAPALVEQNDRVEYLELGGGLQSIGWDAESFAFDNEKPDHTVYLPPYKIASRPVTNGEYLEFIEAGGYGDPSLWLSDGWDHVLSENWRAPLYWEKESGHWTHRFTFSGMQPIRANEPVCHLSYYEADAYARWRGARLPTEYEWENSARSRPGDFHGVGQVWEWTASAYLPYPGFRPFAGAFGEYNGKFMSGQMVLRGGSIASPPSHVRPSYRNFFSPSARWQFSGVRIAL